MAGKLKRKSKSVVDIKAARAERLAKQIDGVTAFIDVMGDARSQLGHEPVYESERMALTMKHLLDGYAGKAAAYVKAILFDIVAPTYEISGDLYVHISEQLIAELTEVATEEPYRLTKRVRNALKWAANPATWPDYACFVGISAMNLLNAEQREFVMQSEEYAAYYGRLKPFLDDLGELATQP